MTWPAKRWGAGLTIAVAALAVVATSPNRSAAAVPSDASQAAGAGTAKLVTQEQFANSISAVFGQDVLPALSFPPLKRVDGLTALAATTAVVTPGALEQFDAVARAIAAKVTDEKHRAYLVGCSPDEEKANPQPCVERFFTGVGLRLYRRPLAAQELALYAGIVGGVTARGGDLYEGIAVALAGMLISPKVLVVSERVEPDPSGGVRLDGYAKATRLSLLLWNAFPDAELLRVAGSGELHAPTGLNHQVERMLASPRAEQGMRAFFKDWLLFEGFDNLTKDPVLYPFFTRRVAAEAQEQTLRTIVHHLRNRRDYRDLFTTRDVFVSRELGPLLREPLSRPDGWTLRQMPVNGDHAGILTLPGFVALHAHPGRSSATLRGKALREIFLCQPVPTPPSNVDFSIVEDPTHARATARERVDAHLENPACAGCHKITDPLGLPLEKFDGAGQFRTAENGKPIDASGELNGTAFDGAAGLGAALRNDPAVPQCLVTRLYAYSLGKAIGATEEPVVERLTAAFAGANYRYDVLLRSIIADQTFFAVGPGSIAALAGATPWLH